MSPHSDRPVSPSSFTKPGLSIGNPNSGHWHPPLLNDSSSGTILHGPYKLVGSKVQNTTEVLCGKLGEVQLQGESHGQAIPIDILPDDVLLEIFDECRKSHDPDQSSTPVWRWQRLVHVCQRWRQLVLGSPRRLDLQLPCTYGTPMRENLGCWPPFPIAIHYNRNDALTPDDEDSVFAALEHPDRVRYVDHCLTGPRSREMAMAMQEPFPELTHLTLRVEFGGRLALPSGFLGGSAPRLQRIHLEGIVFPELPALLSSTSDLVHLYLDQIPQGGYISPEAMVACLAALPRLKFLRIKYRSVRSLPDRIRQPPPVTRTLLPVLTSFAFQGASEYLEDLVAQIDSPRLNQICAQYLNQLFDFQVARLFKFIDRLQAPELTLIRHADVNFSHPWITFRMYPRPESHPDWDRVYSLIRCDAIEGQVSRIAQVFSQPSAMLSRVVHLKLSQYNGSRHGDEWLLLLRKLTAIRTLHVSRELSRQVALALEDITGDMVSGVLPVLDLIYIDGQSMPSVEKFLTVRRLSGRPVTIVDTEAEFHERMRAYANE
ncbi:hypothetical protein EDB89DRAFT_387353 [Lactarius sanguifluus]|nr:hypothetical protein EDB89DRAFT_387353 [Lactarius sanguifluus]